MELDTKTKAAIHVLTAQRNQALDAVANMAGELAAMQEQLAEANKKLADQQKKEE